jgi:hypothetical protein
VADRTGASEVARAAEMRCAAEVSSAARAAEGMSAAASKVATATPEVPSAAAVALRESLPAGEHRGECRHGPKSTFAG